MAQKKGYQKRELLKGEIKGKVLKVLQRSETVTFCYVIFLFFYCSNLKNLLLQSSETLLQKIRKLRW